MRLCGRFGRVGDRHAVVDPAGKETQVYQRIVVPLDGSELAERALPDALQLAELAKAPLHLLRVVDVTRLEQYGAYGLALEYAGLAQVLADEEQQAQAYLDAQVRRLGAEGGRVTSELRRGFAPREIVAASQPGDLVVMASHGRGGISRWLLGSVAEEVVRHAAVPVTIVHVAPDQTERPA
jgi:nucleotide-binding universal stress UspA family protein